MFTAVMATLNCFCSHFGKLRRLPFRDLPFLTGTQEQLLLLLLLLLILLLLLMQQLPLLLVLFPLLLLLLLLLLPLLLILLLLLLQLLYLRSSSLALGPSPLVTKATVAASALPSSRTGPSPPPPGATHDYSPPHRGAPEKASTEPDGAALAAPEVAAAAPPALQPASAPLLVARRSYACLAPRRDKTVISSATGALWC